MKMSGYSGNGGMDGGMNGGMNGGMVVAPGVGLLSPATSPIISVPWGAPLDYTYNAQGNPIHSYPILQWRNGFPKRAWDPLLLSKLVLAEFAAQGWDNLPTQALTNHEANLLTQAGQLASEIDVLLGYLPNRQERAGEIVAQAQDISLHWADMLMITPSSYPRTWALMSCAVDVGQLVTMHYKYIFNRARPVQCYPALMPPITTPPHPSFPNSHALQSALIADTLKLVLENAGDSLAITSTRLPMLDAIAERIGKNREIAGLHFPSDTEASLNILRNPVFEQMRQCPTFQQFIDDARNEWGLVDATDHTLTVPVPPKGCCK